MRLQSMRKRRRWVPTITAACLAAVAALAACSRSEDLAWRGSFESAGQQFQLIGQAQAQENGTVSPQARTIYESMQSLWNRMARTESGMMHGLHGRGMMGRMRAGMMSQTTMMQFSGMNQQMLSYCLGMQQMLTQAGNGRMAGMYGQMADTIRRLLSQLPATTGTTAAAPRASRPSDGAATFAANCAACHGAGGAGISGAFPPLAGSRFVSGSADVPIKIVLHGLQGPITVAGAHYSGFMPAFRGTLTDGEIAAALTYVRSMPGSQGTAVSAEQVRNVRSQTASRSEAFTKNDLGLQ